MPRRFSALTVLLVIASFASVVLPAAPVLAQERQVGPLVRPGILNIVRSVNLTDDQKVSIRKIVQSHQPDVQAARERGDFEAARAAMKDTMQEIAQVLTPEQRDQVKAAIAKGSTGR